MSRDKDCVSSDVEWSCQGLVEHLNVLILDLFRWGAIFDCAWAWRRKILGISTMPSDIQNRAQRGGCEFVGPLDENLFIGKHQKYSWYEPKFTDRCLTE